MLSDIADRIEQIVETERAGDRQASRRGSQQSNQVSDDADNEHLHNRQTTTDQSARADLPPQGQAKSGQSASRSPGRVGESAQDGRVVRSRLAKAAGGHGSTPAGTTRRPAARIRPAAIRALTDYDFMTPEARQLFQELLDMLQQQMTQQAFQGMQQSLSQMTPEDMAEMRQMMQELNEMLEAAVAARIRASRSSCIAGATSSARASTRSTISSSACSSRWAPCGS